MVRHDGFVDNIIVRLLSSIKPLTISPLKKQLYLMYNSNFYSAHLRQLYRVKLFYYNIIIYNINIYSIYTYIHMNIYACSLWLCLIGCKYGVDIAMILLWSVFPILAVYWYYVKWLYTKNIYLYFKSIV